MRSFVTMPGFNGVAAGQTATVTLPVGTMTYHKLMIAYFCANAGNGNQTNTEAHLTQIRMKVNGKNQRVFSAAQIDSINAYHGKAFSQGGSTSGYVEIFLSEPWRRTPRAEDALAWGTADQSTFQIEVDIAAAATSPTLTGHMEVEYRGQNMGPISKWNSYTQPVSATGLITNNTLPKTDAFQAIHAFSANVTDIEVDVDQVTRLKGVLADLTDLYTHYYWTPQASMFHIHFDRTARVSDALPMQYANAKGQATGAVQDFRVIWDMGAATSFSFVTLNLGMRN